LFVRLNPVVRLSDPKRAGNAIAYVHSHSETSAHYDGDSLTDPIAADCHANRSANRNPNPKALSNANTDPHGYTNPAAFSGSGYER
jgi:hypothetical protein